MLIVASCTNPFSSQSAVQSNPQIVVENVSGILRICNQDLTDNQREFYMQIANDINQSIQLGEGESFFFEVESNSVNQARFYCSSGHDMKSYHMRQVGNHRVKIGEDWWTCYVLVYTYQCSNCDYYTTVTAHSIKH